MTSRSCRLLGIAAAWFAFALPPAQINAAETMQIRLDRKTAGTVLVGERVTINVTLLTPTMFADAPRFELPTVPGALLMKVEGSPLLGSEQEGDVSYVTQTHQVALFCLKPGRHEIPPFVVRAASPPKFGTPATEHRLTSTGISIDAKLPPGAENMAGIICSQKLTVSQSWTPQPKKTARVGDAFTRRVSLSTPDVPAMVIPAVPLAKVDGVSAYPKPPLVQDHSERGEFTGARTDSVVYVCGRPGRITFPSLVIVWWDLQHSKPVRETLPSLSIDVAPRPAGSTDGTTAMPVAKDRAIWPWVMIVLILGGSFALWLARKPIAIAWENGRKRREMSEAGRFARIGTACRLGDPVATYNAIMCWLDTTYGGSECATLGAWLYSRNDPLLRREIDGLQTAIVTGEQSWKSVDLWAALCRARREELRHKQQLTDRSALPSLNPT